MWVSNVVLCLMHVTAHSWGFLASFCRVLTQTKFPFMYRTEDWNGPTQRSSCCKGGTALAQNSLTWVNERVAWVKTARSGTLKWPCTTYRDGLCEVAQCRAPFWHPFSWGMRFCRICGIKHNSTNYGCQNQAWSYLCAVFSPEASGVKWVTELLCFVNCWC